MVFGVFASEPTFSAPSPLCSIKSSSVNESSGIAVSPSRPNLFYTMNDSGDTARFFQFSKEGALLNTMALTDAEALDWEDMASATVDGVSYLYFGDIGDNKRERPNITVYRVPEPGVDSPVTKYRKYDFKYPDGSHNAEALMVNPANGDIWIVTKTDNGAARVYMAKEPRTPKQLLSVNTMKLMGTIQFSETGGFGNLVTGGDVSADGKYMLLRTYSRGYEFDFNSKWWMNTPRSFELAKEMQGEAICYSTDGKAIYTTSEGNPCPVSMITVTR